MLKQWFKKLWHHLKFGPTYTKLVVKSPTPVARYETNMPRKYVEHEHHADHLSYVEAVVGACMSTVEKDRVYPDHWEAIQRYNKLRAQVFELSEELYGRSQLGTTDHHLPQVIGEGMPGFHQPLVLWFRIEEVLEVMKQEILDLRAEKQLIEELHHNATTQP